MSSTPAFDLRHIDFEGCRCRPVIRARRLPRPTSTLRIRRFTPRPAEPAADRDPFLRWLLVSSGLDPALYRLKPLARRLSACLRTLRVDSVDGGRRLLERRPDLLPRALDALLIGVTEFFRDAAVFATLRDDVLPSLARAGRPLRVWSAACSTGAELYSVAMLLDESGRLDGARLLGTDCRAGAVRAAKAGWYSAAEVNGVSPALAARYLRPDGDGFRVELPAGTDIRWRTSDVGRTVEPGRWDLILFRNTAIYMDPLAADRIWTALARALAPGGALVTGRAERPHVESLGPLRSCICRKGDTAL